MVWWHHQLDGYKFEQIWGDSEGQGSRVCCSPWGHRVGHDWVTEQQHEDSYRWKQNYRWETLRRLEGEIRKAFWKRNWLSLRELVKISLWEQEQRDWEIRAVIHSGEDWQRQGIWKLHDLCKDREWSLCCWTTYTLCKLQGFRQPHVLFFKISLRTSLMVPWLRCCTPNAPRGGPGSTPGQRTRSHMLQLRVHLLHLKIPCAAKGSGKAK